MPDDLHAHDAHSSMVDTHNAFEVPSWCERLGAQ